ncbi:helix-turn-helix domain-containing protein [Runella slithyformis]|uniref:Uncharacterized protein n=1 Tax=Runella slithyformis (strain ATCC 29530 / DSM 19594 / LMG 11500 / NCIMB 11436 / LSU 4) TaxID=761193 RepID=A0A7U3ZNW9_RUNSL|nr:helix-turn-helix domain-containing protein [Runella slithyformis]AEI50670.1 hypothetical protein Runsl_4332 [Runella slithyformis DSM 19594]
MNPKTQQVIALKNEGWSLRNIAQEVGVSTYTVREIIARTDAPTVPTSEATGIGSINPINDNSRAKLSLTKRFNLLVAELVENSDDCTWLFEEWDDSIHKAKRILDDVLKVCEEEGIEPETLAIYQHTQQLIESMTQVYEFDMENNEESIHFDLSEEIQDDLVDLEISSFEDEFEGKKGSFERKSINPDEDE